MFALITLFSLSPPFGTQTEIHHPMKTKTFIILFALSVCSITSFAQQPTGKAKEIFDLINEARTNPKTFLTKHKTSVGTYKPKLIPILEKSSPVSKTMWDEALAQNCKQRVYGALNPEYKGTNKMCGSTNGSGSGYSDKNALWFICDFYAHLLDEDDIYFGFYVDEKGHAYSWGKTCDSQKKYVFEFKKTIDSSKVDFKKINTAAGENYLTAMDKEMIKEINFVRQYPSVYADIISKHLAEESKLLGSGLSKAKYDAGVELIDELKMMETAQPLYPKKCVYEAAKKHGEDCKQRGFTAHTGSDDSSPFSRIAAACAGLNGNENITGGKKNARILVIQLLIDDGISSRGHRYNMLNPNWKYVGCYGYDGSSMFHYIQNFARD